MKRRVILIVVPLIILALALASGSVLLLRLFSLSVLVLLLGYVWTRLGIRGLTGHVRLLTERCQVGERFGQEVTVSSGSRIPKPLITVRQDTDLPGCQNAAIFSLPPNGSYCWPSEVRCQRRGRYSVGALMATVTDPFGFFSLSRRLGEPQSIIVFPATLDLPFFQSQSYSGPGSGPSRWLISELGPDAARVREYTSGDTLNRIHWHSTAHTGKLMVKEFDADRTNYASRSIWIVLDMHGASQVGDSDSNTAEYGVTIAASLIKRYMDSGKQVGLLATGDQTYVIPPGPEDHHLWNMLEALALMKATGDRPIEQLISSEISRFGKDSIVVVITPAAGERLVMPLRQVKGHGAPVIVISLDPASFKGEVSAANVAGPLISGGFPVYVVRQGEGLAAALDSRALLAK